MDTRYPLIIDHSARLEVEKKTKVLLLEYPQAKHYGLLYTLINQAEKVWVMPSAKRELA